MLEKSTNGLWVKVVLNDGSVLLDYACHMWENDGNAIRFHMVKEHEEVETILVPLYNIRYMVSRKIEEA